MPHSKIENMRIDNYSTFLKEPYRPPSKGGNTNALHCHILEIQGEKYSFVALGSKQLVYKSDTVAFEYEIKDGYKNIIVDTLTTLDRNGNQVVRGNRGYKNKLRTATARLPGSRRDQRD